MSLQSREILEARRPYKRHRNRATPRLPRVSRDQGRPRRYVRAASRKVRPAHSNGGACDARSRFVSWATRRKLTLPRDLAEFYTTLGMLRGGGPGGRVDSSPHRNPQTDARRLGSHVREAQLARPRGNDEGMLGKRPLRVRSRQRSNQRLPSSPRSTTRTRIGWIASDPARGHTYFYFDRAGRFDKILSPGRLRRALRGDRSFRCCQSSPARGRSRDPARCATASLAARRR